MLAGFGPEGRSDDKQQQGSARETAGGNLPAVGVCLLFRHSFFEFGDLGPVFRTEVRQWGRRIVEEPASVHVRCEQHQQAGDEDEMFHCRCGDGAQAGARGERRPAAGFNASDGTMPYGKLCRVEGPNRRVWTFSPGIFFRVHRLLRNANSESSALKVRHTPPLGTVLARTCSFNAKLASR